MSLSNIWRIWYLFRRGKKNTYELNNFEYYLEKNLYNLWKDLNSNLYRHGFYWKFISFDNKKREIAVASIRDRVVHRLLYEYLVSVYDKTFIYDVWSCRRGKGLVSAIERTEYFLTRFPNIFIWRTDIKKFFDNVDQEILSNILLRKIIDKCALALLKEIIRSYVIDTHTHTHTCRGREFL